MSLRISISVFLLASLPSITSAQTERVNVSWPTNAQGTTGTCVVVQSCRNGRDISKGGRFVIFETHDALDPLDTNGVGDVYVRDRPNQTTRRLSFELSGAQGTWSSSGLSLARNARFVAYARFDPTSNMNEIFVHDRDVDQDGIFDEMSATKTFSVVRNSMDQTPNGNLFKPVISDSGRYLAFEAWADNLDLVVTDTNPELDIYWTDRDSDGNGVFDEPGTVTTRLVSYDTTTGSVGNLGAARLPSISGDGLHVAFRAQRALDSNVTGGTLVQQIYVHDIVANTTRAVSVNLAGGYGDGDSSLPALSETGRYLVFESIATGLVSTPVSTRQIYLHDRDVDGNGIFDEPGLTSTEVVSLDVNCLINNSASFTDPSISDDGRYVAYSTTASASITSGVPDASAYADVFVIDRVTCETRLASRSLSGPWPADSDSRSCKISGDGQHVVFASSATDLVAGDTNGVSDVFAHTLSVSPFTSYCVSSPTSLGTESLIGAMGTASVAANNMVLTATSVSPLQPGVFFYGPTQVQMPLGNGTRCVGGGGAGGTVVRIYPFVLPSATGSLKTPLDNTLPSHGQVIAGASLNFQAWFRDPAGGGAGFNLSNGLNVVFGP